MRQVAEAEIASWSELLGSAPAFTASNGRCACWQDRSPRWRSSTNRTATRPACRWPEDRAWCLGTAVDLMTTYVGGSTVRIDALLDDGQLEALAVPGRAAHHLGRGHRESSPGATVSQSPGSASPRPIA